MKLLNYLDWIIDPAQRYKMGYGKHKDLENIKEKEEQRYDEMSDDGKKVWDRKFTTGKANVRKNFSNQYTRRAILVNNNLYTADSADHLIHDDILIYLHMKGILEIYKNKKQIYKWWNEPNKKFICLEQTFYTRGFALSESYTDALVEFRARREKIIQKYLSANNKKLFFVPYSIDVLQSNTDENEEIIKKFDHMK